MQTEIYEQMAALEKDHFWFKARRDILSSCLQTVLPEIQIDRRCILDAGCGSGGNVDFLSAFGDVCGIDGSFLACRLVSEQWRGPVLQGDLRRLPLQSRCCDLISLLDVLEHIDEQQAVLRELSRVLRPGGTLLLTVPAYRHLWSCHDQLHHHKRRYTKSDIRCELVSAGFSIRYLTYYNTILYPLIAGVRLLKRVLNWSEASDLQMPAAWVNGLLYRIFSLERHWIGHLRAPFGVSLLAVAVKPE